MNFQICIYDQMVVWMENLFLGQYEKYLLYEAPYSIKYILSAHIKWGLKPPTSVPSFWGRGQTQNK